MAFSFKYTRISSICQIFLGTLFIVFGIADRATIYDKDYFTAFHTQSVAPIWMGVWIVVTGVIGFAGSNRTSNSDRPSPALIGTYLGFSVVSVVFAAIIIIMYSVGVSNILGGRPCSQKFMYKGAYYDYNMHRYVTHKPESLENRCNTSVAFGSMIIIFAVLEFGIGIWASICCCSAGCCDYSQPPAAQPQMGQVIYIQTQHGPAAYVMTQGANGVPVAVPAMTTSSVMVAPAGQFPIQPQNQQVNPVPQVIYPTAYAGAGALAGPGAPREQQQQQYESKSNDQPPPAYQE